MGVINVTPDSFFDGGRYFSTKQAIALAQQLIDEGADILDIGGESTRPGSHSVSSDEELSRVLPVIEFAIKADIPVSIDTSKPEVMLSAIQAGVDMVNDINALQAPGALEVIAENPVMVCLMHMQGQPETMQLDPQYADVTTEVKLFLEQRAETAIAAGVARDHIMLDPGFGFGKTLAHNLTLLRELNQFVATGFPILAGLSRKSMLGTITGHAVDDRVYASVAAALLAVGQGAKIVRVHDVRATHDAFAVFSAIDCLYPGYMTNTRQNS